MTAEPVVQRHFDHNNLPSRSNSTFHYSKQRLLLANFLAFAMQHVN